MYLHRKALAVNAKDTIKLLKLSDDNGTIHYGVMQSYGTLTSNMPMYQHTSFITVDRLSTGFRHISC